MDITAAVDQASWSVVLTATGSTGTVRWSRRYAGRDTAIGTGPLLRDQPPVNVPIEYSATDDAEAAVAPPVTVAADGPVLSVEGGLYAVQVVVVSYRPTRHINPSRVWPVLGRSDPLVTVHPTLYPSGNLRLYAASRQDMGAIVAMLPTGRPLLLRSTSRDRVPDMVFNYQEANVAYSRDGAADVPAYIDFDYQQVRQSPGIGAPPNRTYADVAAEHADYAAVAQHHGTYLGLLEGAPA